MGECKIPFKDYIWIKGDYFLELNSCLLYTSDAADERSSVDLGGRRIIKKKKINNNSGRDTGDKKQEI